MKRHAFTLVELLVVIAIIGLLSSVAVVSLSGARVKARDAKRLADLKQIRTALALYYDANSAYPQCGGHDGCSTTGFDGDFAVLDIKPAYMATIPKDPTNVSGQYGYYYTRAYKATGLCTLSNTGASTDYILATRFENPSGISGICAGGFNAWDNANLNYLVGS